MAASSEEDDDYQRPYHIEHHYLDVYFDRLFLVGATSTSAYIVTKYGVDNYKAHVISFADAIRNRSLQNGKFMPQWRHYTTRIARYIHACAHATLLCIIEEDGFQVLRDLSSSLRVAIQFDYCDTCCVNDEYVVVVHKNSWMFVFDHVRQRTICNKNMHCEIVDIGFFCTSNNMLIATTSSGDTLFYAIGERDVQSTRKVCLLDARESINFTREIHPHLLATCSRSELSIARRIDDETRIQVRTDFPSTIVDVSVMTGDKKNCILVHDAEGCVQMMNWHLETFRTISNHELFKPHNECRIPIQRIQATYKSMSIYADSFMILLPSADLCVIKFN